MAGYRYTLFLRINGLTTITSRHVAKELRYAYQGEVLICIDQLDKKENGLRCNCTCPKCGIPLEACIGPKTPRYFRHQKDSPDCGITNESVLHLYAKQCLKDAAGKDISFLIPRAELGKFIPLSIAGEKFDRVTLKEVKLEYHCQDTGTIVDAWAQMSNGLSVNIEIKVSHGIDEVKAKKIGHGKSFTVEIDLNGHSLTAFKLEDVKRDVFGLNCKKVFNHPDAQWIQHKPAAIKTSQEVKRPSIEPAPKLPPRKTIVIPPEIDFGLNDTYLSHKIIENADGDYISLEFCDESGEVLNLPVRKAFTKYYSQALNTFRSGDKIKAIEYQGEIVRILGC